MRTRALWEYGHNTAFAQTVCGRCTRAARGRACAKLTAAPPEWRDIEAPCWSIQHDLVESGVGILPVLRQVIADYAYIQTEAVRSTCSG